ncbi:MAG TPA: carboxypeptidase-like regulatory domain-containing protein [Longimicrobium sp.]
MRPPRLVRLSALLFALLAAAPAAAQTLHGRVTDAVDGTPVAAALVAALDSAGATVAWTLSRRDGGYELKLPAGGAVRLHVSRVGFGDGVSPAIAIVGGDRMGVDLSLRRDAVRLEGVEAVARVTPPFRDTRARGFYERMDRGRGMFYTAEQIVEMNRPRTTEVITYRAGVTMRRGKVWLGGDRRGCTPIIYIDGFRKSGVLLDDALAPSDIWGIEIYRNSFEIPNELPRDDMSGNCGVIMIWTLHS